MLSQLRTPADRRRRPLGVCRYASAASDPSNPRKRREIVGAISLPASSLRLPDGGTVLEEMLLLHECPEGGVGQVASGTSSRLRDCGGQNGNGLSFVRREKLLSQGDGGDSGRQSGPVHAAFRASDRRRSGRSAGIPTARAAWSELRLGFPGAGMPRTGLGMERFALVDPAAPATIRVRR